MTSLHDRIAEQARALWESYGRPSGRDEEIWQQAERQVLGADGSAARQGAGSVDAANLKAALTPPHPGLPDGQQASPGAKSSAPSARPSRQQPSRPPVAR